jgi:hypothetical protein
MSELADWTRYVAHTAREDGDVDLAQLTGEPFTTEELARLYVQAEAWATAAGKVKAAIGQALLGVVDKPVEVDGWLVWKGEKRKEVCVDPEGFAEWLTQHPELAGRLFNPNDARKGGLPPAVRDTFYEKQTYGRVEVQSAPLQVIEDAKRKRST